MTIDDIERSFQKFDRSKTYGTNEKYYNFEICKEILWYLVNTDTDEVIVKSQNYARVKEAFDSEVRLIRQKRKNSRVEDAK